MIGLLKLLEVCLVIKGYMDKYFVVIDILINIFWNWIVYVFVYIVNVNNMNIIKLK